jgi:hypothetical protein
VSDGPHTATDCPWYAPQELCENADFQNEALAKVNEALATNLFGDFAAFVDATADRMTAMVAAAGQTGEARGRWCSPIFIHQSERIDLASAPCELLR